MAVVAEAMVTPIAEEQVADMETLMPTRCKRRQITFLVFSYPKKNL